MVVEEVVVAVVVAVGELVDRMDDAYTAAHDDVARYVHC